MEKLYFNLSEEEFSKSRKILLWIVTGMFFLGGIYVAMLSPVFGKHNIPPALCLAPFGIGLIIGAFAFLATAKRKDLYFHIDDEKIEYRYGILKPKKNTFLWSDIKKLVMPHKERKVKVMFRDGTSAVIDVSYIQRKKSTLIRKHLFHAAREKNIEVLKVVTLAHHHKIHLPETSHKHPRQN